MRRCALLVLSTRIAKAGSFSFQLFFFHSLFGNFARQYVGGGVGGGGVVKKIGPIGVIMETGDKS